MNGLRKRFSVLFATFFIASSLVLSGCPGGWFFIAPIPIPGGDDEGVSEEEVEERQDEIIKEHQDSASDS